MTLKCTMILGDCLDVMPYLSRDYIFCFADLPYGCTSSPWDAPISLDNFWACLRPLVLRAWTLAATATYRFSVTLYASNSQYFRDDLIFQKAACSGFAAAKKRPLRYHENILIFGSSGAPYNPQMQIRDNPRRGSSYTGQKKEIAESYGVRRNNTTYTYGSEIYPRSILPRMGEARHLSKHAAQKPVALLDWLIRTYSNPGDNVLDPVSGSGTTAVAALSANRNVVCIEKDEAYFLASVERIRKHMTDNGIDAQVEVRQ